MFEDLSLALVMRAIMPIAAFAGGYMIYRASKSMGGKLGSRLKILAVATGFLALYGILASFMEAGIQLFSYRDGAWSFVHIIIHLSYTTAMLIGFGSIYYVNKGGRQ